MLDSAGRSINYMRISVTDRCNLRCAYCMPPEGVEGLLHREILRYEEILRVVRAGVSLGIDHYRITGGEPLVRKGITDFIRMMKETTGVKHLALTTNGVLFSDMGEALKEAGLDAVNFSLDCMDAESFRCLTRVDAWDDVMKGVRLALQMGLKTKINCVPMEDYNADDWVRLASLAKDNALDVRFIEMMPIGLGIGFKPVNNAVVMARLSAEFGEPVLSDKHHGSGPAEYYDYPDFKGSIGFISAISHMFCETCNRVRMTADGMLKPCLCYSEGLDLKPLLRSGASDEELFKAIEDTIFLKPLCHNFCEGNGVSESRRMVQIGG
jgi:cyclic pyranopterin phosphate synthase